MNTNIRKKKFGIKKEPVVRIWIPKNKKIKSTIDKKKLLTPIIEGPIVKPGVPIVNEQPKKKRKSYKEMQKEKKLHKDEVLKKLAEKDAKKKNKYVSNRLTKEINDKKIKATFKLVSKRYVKKKIKVKVKNKIIRDWRLNWKRSAAKRNVHVFKANHIDDILEIKLKKKKNIYEAKNKKKWPIEWLRLAKTHKINTRLEIKKNKSNKALIVYDPKIAERPVELKGPGRIKRIWKKVKVIIKTRSQIRKSLTKQLNKKFSNKFKKKKKRIIKRNKVKVSHNFLPPHKQIKEHTVRNLRKYVYLNVRKKSTRSISFITWHIIQNDLILKRLYSFLIKKGKKYLALKIVKGVFIKLKELTGLNPLLFIHNYFYSVRNRLKLRIALSKKKKKKIKVPSFLSNKKQLFYTFKQLIFYASGRKNNRYREADIEQSTILDEEDTLLSNIKKMKNYTFMSFTDRIVYILLMFATGNSRTIFKNGRQDKLTRLCHSQKFLLKKYEKRKRIGREYGFLKMKKRY